MSNARFPLFTALHASLLSIVMIACAKVEGGSVVPESLPYRVRLIDRSDYASLHVNQVATAYDSATGTDLLLMLDDNPYAPVVNEKIRAICGVYVGSLSTVRQVTIAKADFPGLERCALGTSCGNDVRGGAPEVHLVEQFRDSSVISTYNVSPVRPIDSFSIPTPDERTLHLSYPIWRPCGGDALLFFRTSNKQTAGAKYDSLYLADAHGNVRHRRVIGTTLDPLRSASYLSRPLVTDTLLVMLGIDDTWRLPAIDGVDDVVQRLIAFDTALNIRWKRDLDNGRIRKKLRLAVELDGGRTILTMATPIDSTAPRGTLLELFRRYDGARIGSRELGDTVLTILTHRTAGAAERVVCATGAGRLLVFDSLLRPLMQCDVGVAVGVQRAWQIGAPSFDIDGDGATDMILQTAARQTIVIGGDHYRPLLALDDSTLDLHFGFLRMRRALHRMLIEGRSGLSLYSISDTPFLTRIGPHVTPLAVGLTLFVLLTPFTILALRRIDYLRTLFRLLTARSDTQGVVTVDRGGVRSANGTARSMLGLGSGGLRSGADGLPEEVGEMTRACLKSGREERRELVVGGAEPRYLTVSVAPLRSFLRRRGCLITVTDATEAVESELRRSMLALAMSIAHDANNPLAAIRSKFDGMLMRMRREGLADAPWLLDGERVVTESIDETSDVIRKLLYITNIAEGAFVDANLRAVVEEWIERSGRRYRRNGIRLVDDIPAELPLLHLEPKHIGLLLQCACDNAADAMLEDQHDGCVRFDAERTAGGGVRLIIADNGTGMDAATLALLERPYFTTKSGGSGLGLRIIRRVCAQHGATLAINSVPGEGTSLAMVFPPLKDRPPVITTPTDGTPQ